MTSTLNLDMSNKPFEILTFDFLIQEVEYTQTLHKINFIASLHGLNTEIHKDFIKAKNLYYKSIN